jgi:hypothetical protein
MHQGTTSILIGVHSPIHSLLVLLSWKRVYGRWPKFWQLVCIFIHDVGHIGLDYLDDYEQKKLHWVGGSEIANHLFGYEAYLFVAGHCESSGFPKSELYKPDKYSWYIAPNWWLWMNCVFEPKVAMGYSKREAVFKFKEQVRQSIESGEFRSTHQMFLDRCQSEMEDKNE